MNKNEKINGKIIENAGASLKTIAKKLGVNTVFTGHINYDNDINHNNDNNMNIVMLSSNISMNPMVFNTLRLKFKSDSIIILTYENNNIGVIIKGMLNWIYEDFDGNINNSSATYVTIKMDMIYDDNKFNIVINTETSNKFIDTIDIDNIN